MGLLLAIEGIDGAGKGTQAARLAETAGAQGRSVASFSFPLYDDNPIQETPVVQLALSVVSLTYGGLLGTYVLGGAWPRARQIDVLIAIGVSVGVMAPIVLGAVIPSFPWHWLPGLAWPWYVALGTAVTVAAGVASSTIGRSGDRAAAR